MHAVLLNDPVKRLHQYVLRRLVGRHELRHFEYFDAPEAICSRRVQVVYPGSFQPDDDDDVCEDCARLMVFLQRDYAQYPEQARRTAEQVRKREQELRDKREKREKAQRAQDKILTAPDIFAFVDEGDDEEAPDLFDLLRRADSDELEPGASDTA
ncbi:hypothetical protein H7J83_00125 [Mycobacterium mantenii]|uniref:Uncharacterized protein n=1 Tax=Mycobacterium mantenii TaxID=560555 RepID=A0A1X0F543_MYCNT|nr:hypothetical protein [Mycobacterium mantenii]MCV7241178.1 hypothetical protein [Mycobacterium mantenii]ORA96932.1 hypothetical protein BST30_28070 [Mycobacterium mantenii]